MGAAAGCPRCRGFVRLEPAVVVCTACGWQAERPDAGVRAQRLQARIDTQLAPRFWRRGKEERE